MGGRGGGASLSSICFIFLHYARISVKCWYITWFRETFSFSLAHSKLQFYICSVIAPLPFYLRLCLCECIRSYEGRLRVLSRIVWLCWRCTWCWNVIASVMFVSDYIFLNLSDFKPFLHREHAVIPARIRCVRDLCSWFHMGVIEDLTWFAATVELTWLVQLTEMSGTSNSGYFVCLLWKGCLNGSLVTNSTWRLTSIYPHFLSRLLHSCFPPKLVSTVCVSQSWTLLDFWQCEHSASVHYNW